MQQYFSLGMRFVRAHKGVVALGVLACVVLFLFLSRETAEEAVLTETLRAVTVASVSDLSAHTTPLPLLGTVVSSNEASVRADSSGRITVYRTQGDFVGAGTVIAEFENASERAGLLSAQGAYESAKAALISARAGSSIAGINSDSSGVNLESAKISTQNTIRSVAMTLDDAIRTKTDPMFSNPQERDSKFTVSISDSKLLITLEEEHILMQELLDARAERNASLSITDDLVSELSTIEAEAERVKQYLDHLSAALALAIPDQNVSRATIDGYKGVVSGARASVSGTFSSIAGARSALNANISGSMVANESFTQSMNGSIAAAEAGLIASEGALRGAEARLEKSIVRSPIQGTINALSVSSGDHVSPYSEIAVVSNNGALEVLGYATADDARVIKVGSKVRINGTADGVVTRIASALDAKTKKIEVRVGIQKGAETLVNGQSVRMDVARTAAVSTLARPEVLRIPLSALKITPFGPVVFTVTASSTLAAHPVTEGTLSGDDVVILKGVSPDMEIVVDARGLKEGQAVTITN